MGIRFILLVNKQGQTRLAQYYEYLTLEERRALEGEIVRKCLTRTEQQCSFVEHRNYKVVYRRYASLFFLVGVDNDEVEWQGAPFRSHLRCATKALLEWSGQVSVSGQVTCNLCSSQILAGLTTENLLDSTCKHVWKISVQIAPLKFATDGCLTLDGFSGKHCAEFLHIHRNELAILEFIHLLVETMDRHFGNVCELDIMFHLEKAHFMLEEMVMNGCIVETSKSNILSPIQLMEKAS